MTTLEQAIGRYMESRSYRRVLCGRGLEHSVRGLLVGKRQPEVEGAPYPYALLEQDGISSCRGKEISSPDVLEALPLAIRESVKAYPNKKPKAVRIYKDLVAFLEKEFGVDIPLVFPYLYSNEFDRQMFIVKELHEPGRGADHLEDRLWTGLKTIGADLKDLESGEVSIMGQPVTIGGIIREDGQIAFESTVHPIFLTTTVEQVIALLDGLRTMSENPAFKGHVLPLVSSIWGELSPYARRRVFELIDSLSLDREWYEQLPHLAGNGLFQTEAQCSSDAGEGNLLNFLKNRRQCSIRHVEDGREHRLSRVLIVDFDDEHILALREDIPYSIRRDSILGITADKATSEDR